jgi:hypothetical protein
MKYGICIAIMIYLVIKSGVEVPVFNENSTCIFLFIFFDKKFNFSTFGVGSDIEIL